MDAKNILEAVGLPPALGFGLVDLALLAAFIGSALWVWFSRDSHGFVTPGYRTPYRELPASARRKILLSIVLGAAFLGLLIHRVATHSGAHL